MEIVSAVKDDLPTILQFIQELAIEEAFPYPVTVSLEDLEKNLFDGNSHIYVELIRHQNNDIGFAVYYETFATTTGRKGFHLDDFYIKPEFRSLGFGKQFMQYLARKAKANGYARLDWWCVEQNQKARKFYLNIGAHQLDDLVSFRMNEQQIMSLAEKD